MTVLIYNGEQFTCTPSIDKEACLAQIQYWLGSTHYFSHFLVDGKQLEGDLETILEQAAHEKIEIVAIEAKPFVNGLLLSAEDYLQRAIPSIQQVATHFLTTPPSLDYGAITDLVDALQWLHRMIVTIDQSIVRPPQWDDVVQTTYTLEQELLLFERAIEKQDAQQIGNWLVTQLVPNFQQLQSQLTSTIDTVGSREAVQ